MLGVVLNGKKNYHIFLLEQDKKNLSEIIIYKPSSLLLMISVLDITIFQNATQTQNRGVRIFVLTCLTKLTMTLHKGA